VKGKGTENGGILVREVLLAVDIGGRRGGGECRRSLLRSCTFKKNINKHNSKCTPAITSHSLNETQEIEKMRIGMDLKCEK